MFINLQAKSTRWLSGKESTYQCRSCKRYAFDPWIGKILWRREWLPTLVFLPGESHRQPMGLQRVRQNRATSTTTIRYDWWRLEGEKIKMDTCSGKPMRGRREKTAICRHGREPSERNSPEDT